MRRMELIEAKVGNRITTLEYPYPDEVREFFQFRPKGYQFSPKYKMGVWDGNINMMRGSRVGTGLFLALRKEIEHRLRIKFRLEDVRLRPEFLPLESITLPPDFEWMEHQQACIRKMIRASGHGGLVLNATGTGKTVTAGGYLKCLQGGGVFFVDELTLLKQAHDELELLLEEDVGVVGGGVFEPQRITVSTVQTPHKHQGKQEFRAWFRTLQAVLLDEVHLCLNNRIKELVKAIQPYCCFGLTATLQLTDDQTLMEAYNLCGKEVYTYPYREAVEDENLCPGVVIAIDLIRTTEADYSEMYDRRIVRSKFRNQLIEDIIREGVRRKKRIILLVDRVPHVRIMSRRLADIPHGLAYGRVKVDDRVAAKQGMESGKLPLIIANRVFKKGINIKAADVIIDAASMKSEDDAVQKFGRGARLNNGKRGFIYFDIGERKERGSAGVNVFRSATLSRRRALTKLGAPLFKFTNADEVPGMYDKAERTLSQMSQIGLFN